MSLNGSSVFNGSCKTPSEWLKLLLSDSSNSSIKLVDYSDKFFTRGLFGYDKNKNFYLYCENDPCCQFIMKFKGDSFSTVKLRDFIDLKLESCCVFWRNSQQNFAFVSLTGLLDDLIESFLNVIDLHFSLISECSKFISGLRFCDNPDLVPPQEVEMILSNEHIIYHGFTCKVLSSPTFNIVITPSVGEIYPKDDGVVVTRSLTKDNPFVFRAIR